jgi:hypothetical protein
MTKIRIGSGRENCNQKGFCHGDTELNKESRKGGTGNSGIRIGLLANEVEDIFKA